MPRLGDDAYGGTLRREIEERLPARWRSGRCTLPANWEEHLTDDAKLESYYLSDWRAFHGNDHLPLWVELKIDFSAEYLDDLANM